MLLKTFLIFLVSIFGYAEYFLSGRGQVYRPIVLGALTGLVLGDLKTGLIVGANLELAFIGMQDIGASVPQDTTSAAIIGTAFAISTGKGTAAALTFGVPLSMLILFIQNVFYIFVSPMYVHKCDEYAEMGDSKKLSRMAFWGGTIVNFLPSIIIVPLCFYFGNTFAKTIIAYIPSYVQNGLVVASEILPAFGFAMLLRMIMNKKILPFFFLGFLLTEYLKVPVIGVALFGVVYIILSMNNENSKTEVKTEDEDF